MKLATGTKLNCPQCRGELCQPVPHDEKYVSPGSAVKELACIGESFGEFKLFFAECDCGLCMFCQWTPDGWEYRVML